MSLQQIERRLHRFLDAPERVWRLELIRIAAPLSILGFLSSRIAHASEWLGDAGFRVPDLGGDYRQALFLPALPETLCSLFAALLVAAGLMTAIGFKTRVAAVVFAVLLAWAGLADRLSAFTVTKLAPVIALALAAGAAGQAMGVDAKRKKLGVRWNDLRPAGALRFFQALLVVFYAASGICKLRADWLRNPYVLFTQLHDSYQTVVSLALASHLPPIAWTIVQGIVLALETLAPLWFLWKRTRPYAVVAAVTMHAMIGLMFWPVRWFALLMIGLVVSSYLSEGWTRWLGMSLVQSPSRRTGQS